MPLKQANVSPWLVPRGSILGPTGFVTPCPGISSISTYFVSSNKTTYSSLRYTISPAIMPFIPPHFFLPPAETRVMTT